MDVKVLGGSLSAPVFGILEFHARFCRSNNIYDRSKWVVHLQKKWFPAKRWHQDSSKTICVSFFPMESIKYPYPIKASKSPLLVPEMVATASAEKTPSAPPLATEGAAEATGLEGTERSRPLVTEDSGHQVRTSCRLGVLKMKGSLQQKKMK